MAAIARVVLALSWAGFCWPFIFRAPHWQKRRSVVAVGPTRVGILLEATAIVMAWTCRRRQPPAGWRLAAAMIVGPAGAAIAFSAVKHLGRQFRIQAGLWEDHELVRTGPYAVVRHPILVALSAELVASLLVMTRWPWWLVSLALFVAGTEIRVRTEDRLLASRFGAEFEQYRAGAPAWLPGVR